MEINTGYNVFTQSPHSIRPSHRADSSLSTQVRLQLLNLLSYFRMMITQTMVTSTYNDKDPEHLKLIWSCHEEFPEILS